MNNKTPREVADAVRSDFRSRGLTIKEAAALCGTSPACLSSALSRNTYMGRVTATRLADTFGYDLSFLYTGAGTLRPADGGPDTPGTPPASDLLLRQVLSVCTGMAASLISLQQMTATALERIAALEAAQGRGK